MTPLDRYRQFAGYNAWANGRLYDAASALDDSDYRAERGAFFGSLHRTLNHLVVTDRIWMRRLTGGGPTHASLDEIPFDHLAGLREARDTEDARITAYVEGLDPAILGHPFRYENMAGQAFSQPLSTVLDHFFNHQTHHRGQAHVLVSAAGAEPPSLDMIVFQRATGVCAPV